MSYKQSIYNVLRRRGLSEAAALGFLGNWQCESGNEPFRVQGDFSPYRTASKAYVQGVTNGSISRDQFAHDQKGFGLAQWTFFSRKYALYDYWKSSGKALDDAAMQTDFAYLELEQSYPALLAFLKSTTDVFTATSRICREYERPAVNNIDARFSDANKIKYEIDLNNWKDDPAPDPTPTPTPEPQPPKEDHSLVLRTIDENCDGFDETLLLKGLLICRKYDFAAVSEKLWDTVKDFQRYAFPNSPQDWDGIVGQKTWTELLKR